MHHPVDPADLMSPLQRAATALRGAERLAVLTGAGVSAESGVPTFRGSEGLWEGHSLEDVATPEGFERDPALVWRFYNMRRSAVQHVAPNPGHHALAEMERRRGRDRFTLITQNIDGLHQAAGNSDVLELHGSLARVRCSQCLYRASCPDAQLPDLPACPSCGHLLRPDVVWFHEILPQDVWERAVEAVASSQCLLVVGTSAVVYPAAGLIDLALRVSTPVIEVNLERTSISYGKTIGLYGPSGQVLPELLHALG